MPKNGYEMTGEMSGAVALVMEQNPKDWGANEHLTALRYLVLACSDKAKLPLAEVAKLDEKAEIRVNWKKLTAQMHQSGKLAECANFKKFLADDYPQFAAVAKATTKYA